MDDLIKALRIFEKYMSEDYQKNYPFHCEHDTLHINCDAHPDDMNPEDREFLEKDFHWEDEYDGWISFKYGSC